MEPECETWTLMAFHPYQENLHMAYNQIIWYTGRHRYEPSNIATRGSGTLTWPSTILALWHQWETRNGSQANIPAQASSADSPSMGCKTAALRRPDLIGGIHYWPLGWCVIRCTMLISTSIDKILDTTNSYMDKMYAEIVIYYGDVQVRNYFYINA